MTTNLKAIYEHGVLRLKEPLSLPDGTQVDITLTSPEVDNGVPSQIMDEPT
jgi:predicted DNA-binding antitoxin AbrB/MazE fold protein